MFVVIGIRLGVAEDKPRAAMTDELKIAATAIPIIFVRPLFHFFTVRSLVVVQSHHHYDHLL